MSSSGHKQFEVFYDGDCPLCHKEIKLLDKLDRKGLIRFTNLASPDFDPKASLGLSMDVLMAEIHGRFDTGETVKGVEVFRQLYSRTCFAFLVPLTRFWGISHLLDVLYSFFAKYRLSLTGRCTGKTCSLG